MRPPLHHAALMDTHCSLSRCLTLALISDACDIASVSTDRDCRAIGPNIALACVSNLMPPESWSTSPPHWEFWSLNTALCCLSEGKSAIWGCTETSNEDQPALPSWGPKFHRPPCALMFCLEQPEPRTPVRHPDNWPHIQQIRPARS